MGVDVNHCILEGRLGADPEERTLSSGTKICSARIAVSDDYKGKDGQWVSRTYWISLTAWSRNAEQLMEFRKGDKIVVVGKWVVEEFTNKEGKKQSFHKLEVHSVSVKLKMQPAAQRAEQQEQRPAERTPGSAGSADFDDDVPF